MSIYDAAAIVSGGTRAIENSPLDPMYAPEEQIPVITVSNFPALGNWSPCGSWSGCRIIRAA